MNKSIEATINEQKIRLFYGATFKNALLKVDEKLYNEVIHNNAVIYDQFGNKIGVTGAVDDGFSYTVVSKNDSYKF
jgi:hypothetical protein